MNSKNFRPGTFMPQSSVRNAALALCFTLGAALPSLHAQMMRPGPPGGPPLERALSGGQHGRWWDDSQTAQQIGLSTQQQTRMDGIFQQHKLKLIDMQAALEKQETILEPLVSAAQLDKSKLLPQIDAVADARANLEKANAHMLLDLREVLTPEQWQKLQAMAPRPFADGRDRGRWGYDRRDGMRLPQSPQQPAAPQPPPQPPQ